MYCYIVSAVELFLHAIFVLRTEYLETLGPTKYFIQKQSLCLDLLAHVYCELHSTKLNISAHLLCCHLYTPTAGAEAYSRMTLESRFT